MKRHYLKALFISASLILTSLGISFADDHKRGGTLIASMGSNPRHLNPAVQSGIATGFPGSQLFATPIRYDNNWEPQPYLAESWEITDGGKTVKLNLVKKMPRIDPKPMKAVNFSNDNPIVRLSNPNTVEPDNGIITMTIIKLDPIKKCVIELHKNVLDLISLSGNIS